MVGPIFNRGWFFRTAPTDTQPIAAAGPDQAVRVGYTVNLDGSASFDDNTSSANLLYSWTFSSRPGTSTATLFNASTANPSFTVDQAGSYFLQLVVKDEGGQDSVADEVIVSTDNQAPTANAGADQMAVALLSTVSLNGGASTDPDGDPLTYAWAMTAAPTGSMAALNGSATATPYFQPDQPGTYTLTLNVSDFVGAGAPDTVEITAITATAYAEQNILAADQLLSGLTAGLVTTAGNQNAFGNFLSQAVKAIQKADTSKAIDKLNDAIARTDGCERTGVPDGNGGGRDWITDCATQAQMLAYLRVARDALTP